MRKRYECCSRYLILILILGFYSCNRENKSPTCDTNYTKPPELLYGKIFYKVQNSKIFSDSKTFCDAKPKYPVNIIVKNFNKLRNISDTALLKLFLDNNFSFDQWQNTFHDKSDIYDHINILWGKLIRTSITCNNGTLIPLPEKYIVPGGRFTEMYYWDSYFTMLGLTVDNRIDLIENMIDNFSFLINTYGFIPNGNRTYYLSRSQPPFYALMISLLAETKHDKTIYEKYLIYLRKEYYFWMDGSKNLKGKLKEFRRVVRLDDSTILNRYWDDKNIPRSEAYLEDIKVAQEAGKFLNIKKDKIYRNIRAAAESGWDFSSRWLDDRVSLCTIQTTNIIPVDLNSLLYNLEMTLSKCYKIKAMKDSSEYFRIRAIQRKKAIERFCWNKGESFYMDYNFKAGKSTNILSLAALYPLFFKMADEDEAQDIADKVKELFLRDGGLTATTINSDQQWDAPNGWAPLQWIAIIGLKNYNIDDLADEIKNRWLALVKKVYCRTGKLLEKYNVVDTTLTGGGGEYPTQDGFGWTNGVFLTLLQLNRNLTTINNK